MTPTLALGCILQWLFTFHYFSLNRFNRIFIDMRSSSVFLKQTVIKDKINMVFPVCARIFPKTGVSPWLCSELWKAKYNYAWVVDSLTLWERPVCSPLGPIWQHPSGWVRDINNFPSASSFWFRFVLPQTVIKAIRRDLIPDSWRDNWPLVLT